MYTRCMAGARVAQPVPPRARSAGGTAHATRASACTGLHRLGRCERSSAVTRAARARRAAHAALVCSHTRASTPACSRISPPPKPQAPAAAITAPKSKVKAVKAVDVPKGGAVLDSYQKALDDKPIFTKACTSGVGFAVSDVLTQLFIEKMDFDLKRLVKMASFGFLLHGTTGHFFYNFLDGKLK